ncbi:MAG: 1-deoxy-D-xylulose-5-phosphate synthase [Ruminococcus sp.]|nr:1-deoxy-D-xylulose-5-phosphate synthase [Ruminococcus sp.]
MKENNNIDDRIKLSEIKLPEELKNLSHTQCNALCKELRRILITTVSKTGGHLSSNLGVVELTLALHRNFNSPEDKIVWDVGHQSYVHKLLTGRADLFPTLRQENGISGFPKPSESEHDSFISGHSSTSVSVACGIAEAMSLQGKDTYAVAVIGDGAMTGGMFYEGMNNGGKEKNNNLIVILNDNTMSISKNVGALARYLKSLRNTKGYVDTKRAVEKTLLHIPVLGKSMAKGIKNAKDSVKNRLIEQSTIFEDMGFVYLGPVNGHNIEELDEILTIAKSYHKPVFVHVKTVKGKGYIPAEKNPGEYHGISKFDVVTGNPEISVDECYSTVFGKELKELAGKDKRICAITAAMKYGTGLQFFASEHPERFYDVGIAEQHAVTFASGLASMGQIPVFAVYSSFLQRSYDQLVHDTAIGKYHIVLGVDRAGVVGEDGETHQGLLDVPMLTSIPGTTIYSPSCYEEVKMCLHKAIYEDTGITAVRYPRGADSSTFDKTNLNTEYTFTESENSDILLISYGRIYEELYKAKSVLDCDGIKTDLLKLTRIYPIAEELCEKAMKYGQVIFFEESMSQGSISEKFGRMLAERGYSGVYNTVACNDFVKQASVKSCLKKLGLTCEKITEYVRKRSIAENGKA